MNKVIIIILALVILPWRGSCGEDCLAKLQEEYAVSKLIVLKAELSVYSTIFEDTEKYDVDIFIADSGFYRVELDRDIYLFDGEKVWEYSYENNQATFRKVVAGERPVDQISFIKNLDRFYNSEAIKPCRIYELNKADSSAESLPDEMTLFLSDGKLKKIEYYDLNGDLNTFLIRDVRIFDEFNRGPFQQDFPDSTEIIALP